MSTYYNKVKDYLLNLEYNIVQEDTAEELFVVENPDIYKSLLIKNREIIHGAFTLDESGKKVIFRDTLQLENLDQNELEATLNSLEMLLSEYSEEIISFSKL